MLSPGSTGWINKYFALIKQGRVIVNMSCPNEYTKTNYIHLLSGQTGLVFGHCTQFLFFNRVESEKWTEDEKLKLLLFEMMLWAYIEKNNINTSSQSVYAIKEQFIYSLGKFYAEYLPTKSVSVFSKKKTTTRKIETVFAKRISTSQRIFDNQWWFKTMSNIFVYLDVVFYCQFLEQTNTDTPLVANTYSDYAYNVLVTVCQVVANAPTEDDEKRMLQGMLSLSILVPSDHEKIMKVIEGKPNFSNFSQIIDKNELLRRFCLDLAVFTAYGNAKNEDIYNNKTLQKIVSFFNLENKDFEESIAMVENMMWQQGTIKYFWFNKNIYQKVQDNISIRWKKIILRNKDKLLIELEQSKELVMLIKKSTVRELTAEEKEKVRVQFLDIVRTIPMLAIFMLPGGTILLPFILKLLPTLLPSAFRDNEIDT